MSNYEEGDFKTKYGVVHTKNPGSFSIGNLQTYKRPEGNVELQGPALRAFKAAELRATPRRLRRKGKVLPILITGVGYRDYATQKDLYENHNQPPGRYADPDGSLHVEALAVDIDMNQGVLRRARIKRALEAEGWHYAVSGEPWHASFRLAG